LGGAVGAYGSFYDTTDQPIATINTAQAITINSAYGANNVSITSGSRITINNPGTYQLTLTASLSNLANSVEDATFWIKLNGSDYPNSATSISLQPRKNVGEPSETTETIVFTGTSTTSGDYVEVYWSGTSTDLSLNHHAAGTSPVTPVSPSVIVSLIQVMFTQSGYSGTSGYSGFSGISGFSGAVGASGTSGFSGIDGASGFSGISGFSGYSGGTGSDGASGISGYSGFSGAVGASGISGYSGYSGGTGSNGASGFSGYSGYSGNATGLTYDQFTATAAQTTFTTSTTYSSGKIQVFANGVLMRNGSDVTVTSGTSVVFATGLASGTLVDLEYPRP